VDASYSNSYKFHALNIGIQNFSKVTHSFPVYKFYSSSADQGDRRHDCSPRVYGCAVYSKGGSFWQ